MVQNFLAESFDVFVFSVFNEYIMPLLIKIERFIHCLNSAYSSSLSSCDLFLHENSSTDCEARFSTTFLLLSISTTYQNESGG